MSEVTSAFDIELLSIDGSTNIMEHVAGQVLLVVNVASKAGYTPKCSSTWSHLRTVRQFRQLQYLHDHFSSRGFSVVGVPCNQFGKQEPLEDADILRFMSEAYPFVTFPISTKVDVNGKNRHDLYTFLMGGVVRRKSTSPANMSQEAMEGWNVEGGDFARVPHAWEKFVIGRSGRMVTRFNWQSNPLDTEPLTTGEHWTIMECIDEILG